MKLVDNLYNHFQAKAEVTKVANLIVGLGYTALCTDDGGLGIAYTYVDNRHCCSINKDYRDYEGEYAIDLLALIKDTQPLKRSMALALINALNYSEACALKEDLQDQSWINSFNIGSETRVAMVGLFRPLIQLFKERGALVEVLDDFKRVGKKDSFYGKLADWAEVLLLTSTSILNNSTEEILSRIGSGVNVVMLGPSTPLVADCFAHLPVRMLAGTVPVDKESVLKAIRYGAGTPVIHRYSRKVHLHLK